jgi:hypothetical protein
LLDEGETAVALIDRGYLASPRIAGLRSEGKDVLCKPWPSRNRGRYTKEDFRIDLSAGELTCPAGLKARISPKSLVARFAATKCDVCAQRSKCTAARLGRGRSISIHAQEELLIQLRASRKTSDGRRALRQRVVVEHSLAKLGAIQGPRARYKGTRRNILDARRCAAVVNIQAIARQMTKAA